MKVFVSGASTRVAPAVAKRLRKAGHSLMPPKSFGRRRLARSILPAVALLAISGTASGAVPPKPSSDRFYKPPPGFRATAPGTILRSRRIALTPGTPVAGEGASAVYQVLYRTTDEHGAPSATVATVFVPRRRATGPRRLVSYQIAEDSLTTACAPSYTLRLARSTGPHIPTGPDPIRTMLTQGWDVVTSDYEGPKSEFAVPNLEGRMTLDGIRAAEQLPGADLPGRSTEVGLLGYSGGSIPSVSGARLAPTYAPALRLVGVTAGGIDADPEYILAHLDGSLLFGGLMVGMVGIDRAYPELNPLPLLNAAGRAIARKDTVDGYGCGGGILAWAHGTAAKYTNYPTSQALASVPRLKRVLTELNLARGPVPTAPSYIYNTIGDEIMRIRQVDALVGHWCAAGDRVYYARSSVGDHISGISVYNSLAIRYLQSRFAGHKALSTCASGPHDPKQ